MISLKTTKYILYFILVYISSTQHLRKIIPVIYMTLCLYLKYDKIVIIVLFHKARKSCKLY